jgi:hypothetical protein
MSIAKFLTETATLMINPEDVQPAFTIYEDLYWSLSDGEEMHIEVIMDAIIQELNVTPKESVALARRILAFINTAALEPDINEAALSAGTKDHLGLCLSHAVAKAPLRWVDGADLGLGEGSFEAFEITAFRKLLYQQ